MATATIKTPLIGISTGEKSFTEATGSVVWFVIGGKRIKFLMQKEVKGQQVSDALLHFKTGCVVVNANRIKAVKMANFGSYRLMTSRQAAAEAINKLTLKVGADTILEAFKGEEVIN